MKIFWLLSTKNTNNNVNILKLKNLQRILKSDITKGTITRNENEDKGTGIFFQGVTIASMMLFDRPGYDGVDEGLITRGRRGVVVERREDAWWTMNAEGWRRGPFTKEHTGERGNNERGARVRGLANENRPAWKREGFACEELSRADKSGNWEEDLERREGV